MHKTKYKKKQHTHGHLGSKKTTHSWAPGFKSDPREGKSKF